MLKSLQVVNFALIEQVQIDFVSGLNILTGETGAGKSILIDAINVVLGGRASVDAIRTGCDFFRVEVVFDVSANSAVKALLEKQSISLEEDTLIISRRVNRNGKNTIIINGCQTPLMVLRQFGELLVDMHGQHENQALLRSGAHMELLDAFDMRIGAELEKYRQIYQQWLRTTAELSRLNSHSRDREQRIDMLTWQTQEISAANLRAGEEEDVEAEVSVLGNAERISKSAQHAHALLNQGTKGNSGIMAALIDVKKEIETVVRYDSRLSASLVMIQEAFYQLDEVAMEISSYCDNFDFNPQRLAKLQDRLDIIYKLKKKYGASIEEILQYYHQALDELALIDNASEKIAALTNQKTKQQKQLELAANELHKLRCESAEKLSQEICCHLADLGIPNARLIFDITTSDEYTISGNNQVVMLFSANLGEELKALHKIASGGELSRIALAIKTVCAKRDDIDVMVFDEIDAGIGGQTAQMVAEKVALVACNKQVLCITHLPQMACMADGHYYITKVTEGDRTYTTVRGLSEDEQIMEITRMITGKNITAIALENTAQLVSIAKEKKEIWKNKAQA